jgi:class 3 adenylate cyclase/CHASE2 domain-containing sensor protein
MAVLTRRDLIAAASIALLVSALIAAPQLDRLRGLSIDVLTALRWAVLGARHDPSTSPTVVVAIDEETFNTPPFNRTPTVTWTRELAKILTALIEGGAIVVGLDLVFPNSIEQSEIPFGEETLGSRVRGFDRDFLRALALAARSGKMVLGQIQHQQFPVQPADPQRIAVGHQRNIRPLNLHTDPDDVVRRMPVSLDIDGQPVVSMPVELAARALGVDPERDAAGALVLGGRRVPTQVPNTFALNFEGGGEDIPTYSLADLRTCAEQGRSDYFRAHFAGRIVLIGTVLDIEDRKVTSKRFSTGLEGKRAAPCASAPIESRARFERDTIAGVYVHATAVNNLMRSETLVELAREWHWVLLAVLASMSAAAALLLGPAGAALAVAGALLVWLAAAIAAFQQSLVLPLMDALAAGFVTLAVAVGYRFAVVDRDKRLLRKSFALYLPPAVIDRMLASNTPPALGGELRDVTVYFSDVAGFSALSEKLAPADLVSLMNAYLSAMTDIIEANGGFVDKYVGDAIVAIFGAPVLEGGHAQNAVRAALQCKAALEAMNRSGEAAFRGHRVGQRIGLNSGQALIGNIGSRRRLNYTAIGDAVNVAARLESANKVYGTSIIAAGATVDAAGRDVIWRELDLIRAAGMTRPFSVFEPLGIAGTVTPQQTAMAEAYAEGLALWRAGAFAAAAEAFSKFAEVDPPARRFFERAKALAVEPPAAGWEPVNVLEEK